MSKKKLLLTLAVPSVLLFALALSGCGDSVTMSSPAGTDDEETIRQMTEDDGFFELPAYDSEEIAIPGGESRERGEIDPLTFWREVTDVVREREVVIDYEAGTADVTVTRDVWGNLVIVDWDMVQYEKPMHHSGVRYAQYERDPDWAPQQGGQQQGGHHRPWILTAVSGVLSQSDTLTVSISSIHIQSASVDTVITDPLALMPVPEGIMTFDVGEEVTVTVTASPPDALLFLNTPRFRTAFTPDGQGTYTGTWTVQSSGHHVACVQAIARDSIFDSEYPDDALIWGMPYDVVAVTE
jgi:hypothetical protein